MHRKLQPMAWSLRISDALALASRSLWIACVLVALILLLGWITPIEHVRLWALLPLLLWLLGIVGMLLLRPMPLPMVARRVDAALNLRERLATALELESLTAHGDLDDEQHADAEQTAAGLAPKQIPLHVNRRPLLWALAPLALGLILAFAPNPQDAVLRERAQVKAELARAADQGQQLAEQVSQDQRLTPEEREALERQLAELEERLRNNPGDKEQALADLSSAEAQLQQNVNPQADAQQAALEQMARSIESLAGQQPTQRPSLEQAQQALQDLARQLEQMTPEQRQQAADELNRLAAQLQQTNPPTAQNLRDAA